MNKPYKEKPGDRPDGLAYGDAPSGIWKQELLKWLGKLFNIRIFVETGTCDGGTLGGVYEAFDECHSIELSGYYYQDSMRRFKGIRKIHLYHGNSAYVLPEILSKLPDVPLLFWLDAHPSCFFTADAGDVLGKELKAILSTRSDSVIVIDDRQDGKLADSYPEIREDLKDWVLDFREVVLLLHGPDKTIPPFED